MTTIGHSLLASLLLLSAGHSPGTVEQWGLFDIALQGPSEGNPFVDVNLFAQFRQGDRTIRVNGFYDGDKKSQGSATTSPPARVDSAGRMPAAS